MSEFAIIRRLLREAPALRKDVVVGPGDDGAVLAVPSGQELVVTTDTLICGRHFPADTAPADIAWKALAANLSDLAAMAANPAWITIAMTLPEASESWLNAFIQGLFPLLQASGASLVGGDITRGDLSITVQAMGLVPMGMALRRDGARAGDQIAVTGTLGDAALGLALWQGGAVPADSDLAYLQSRLTRPQPRTMAASALRGRAHAGVDISDGLAADLEHMLTASSVGARVYASALPRSAAFLKHCSKAQYLAAPWTGGDDYELCVTLPTDAVADVAARLDCDFSIIGEVVAQPGLQLLDDNGTPVQVAQQGYDHFAD